MKQTILLLGVALLFITSCKKIVIPISSSVPKTGTVQPAGAFVQYTIKKGQQECDKNTLTLVQYTEQRFVVKFDSSAIYKTAGTSNQADINKLYGFSDNNAHHHAYSARFGWRWSNNALRLFGYVYNDSVRTSAELGVIKPGVEYNCSIKAVGSNYIFSLDNKAIVMARKATTFMASGYKLYPYFGGNETAPHDIKIFIKEL